MATTMWFPERGDWVELTKHDQMGVVDDVLHCNAAMDAWIVKVRHGGITTTAEVVYNTRTQHWEEEVE